MTDRATWLGDLVGRVLIVVLFSFASLKKLKAIVTAYGEWVHHADQMEMLRLMSEVANLSFLVLIVATTLVRLQPLKSAQGIEARVIALAGTFAAGVITVIPPTVEMTPALRIVSLCLTLVGFGLSAYVLYWLGRSFSIMAEARRLVTAGPYSIVRHPLYAVEEIAVLGIFLQHLSPTAAAFLIVQWSLQLRRMHHEEIVLRTAFPEYNEYAEVTPKVIPFLGGMSGRKAA